MRVTITDTDREALADWIADLAFDRAPHALDALADARHARVTRHEDGLLAFEGRVVLLLADGVADVAVSVHQGLVSVRPWRLPEASTLPLPETTSHH